LLDTVEGWGEIGRCCGGGRGLDGGDDCGGGVVDSAKSWRSGGCAAVTAIDGRSGIVIVVVVLQERGRSETPDIC
jgi:hypothetical protein